MHRGIQIATASSILIAAGSGALLLDNRTRLAEAWKSVVTIPADSELKLMEAQVGDACRCARRLKPGDGARDACWSAFRRTVNRYPHSEWATACAPLSASGISFGDNGEISITTEYGAGACTAEEARILEAVWTQTENPDDPKSYELAERRMQETVQRFIRGERVAVKRASSGGCAG